MSSPRNYWPPGPRWPAHWIADRQVGPGLLSYGTEEQRRRILPRIAAGRYFSAIGMSEPQAGSDLAAAAARATRTDGGWVLSGMKVWTSGAHLSHQIVVLARTSPLDPQRRHAGFSQFIVPTDSPGVTISPIVLMSGEHHFNEVNLRRGVHRRHQSARRGRRRLASGHRRTVPSSAADRSGS